ncbi:hypothetical protein OC842_007827, partial [Tilletia horrida]
MAPVTRFRTTEQPELPHLDQVGEAIREDVQQLHELLQAPGSPTPKRGRSNVADADNIMGDAATLFSEHGCILNALGARTCLKDRWLDDSAMDFMFYLLRGYVRATQGQDVQVVSAPIFLLLHILVERRRKSTRTLEDEAKIRNESRRNHLFGEADVTIIPVNDGGLDVSGISDRASVGSHWVSAVVVGPKAALQPTIKDRLSAIVRPGKWTIGWIDSSSAPERFRAAMGSVIIDLICLQHGSAAASMDDIVTLSCPAQKNGYDCGPLAFQNTLALFRGTLPDITDKTLGERRDADREEAAQLAGPRARKTVQAVMAAVWDRVAAREHQRRWAGEEMGSGMVERTGVASSPSTTSEDDRTPLALRRIKTPSATQGSARPRAPRAAKVKASVSTSETKRDRKITERDDSVRLWYDGAEGLTYEDLVAHFKKQSGYKHLQAYTTKAEQPAVPEFDGSVVDIRGARRSFAKVPKTKRMAKLTGSGAIAFETADDAAAALSSPEYHDVKGKKIT